MDRLVELRKAYMQALVAGEGLLTALAAAQSDESYQEITELVDEREAATRHARELFRPGDQQECAVELQALLQQQRAIEAQMRKLEESLKEMSSEARRARTVTTGLRRIMKPDSGSRLVNHRI